MAFLDTRAGTLAAEGGMRPEQVAAHGVPSHGRTEEGRDPRQGHAAGEGRGAGAGVGHTRGKSGLHLPSRKPSSQEGSCLRRGTSVRESQRGAVAACADLSDSEGQGQETTQAGRRFRAQDWPRRPGELRGQAEVVQIGLVSGVPRPGAQVLSGLSCPVLLLQ